MKSSRRRIAIVGGGSYAWTPQLAKDILLKEEIRDSEFMLLDINPDASRLVATFLDKLNGKLATGATFVPTDDRELALKGADYVIITISTGGLDAMALDISIPEKFGIFHTVGDTSGPGGWARAIRNFAVFRDLAHDINRLAPGAVVLNYTNPMAVLTDVLCRICAGPVVGLCHGLFENAAFLKQFYRLKSEDELAMQYAGLNHFFWMTAIRGQGAGPAGRSSPPPAQAQSHGPPAGKRCRPHGVQIITRAGHRVVSRHRSDAVYGRSTYLRVLCAVHHQS